MKHGFIIEGVSSADIFYEEDFKCSIETTSVDKETIKISNVLMNNIDTTRLYDDPRAQMDESAKCSVTNILEILQNVTGVDKKKDPVSVHMKGATSSTLIIHAAKGWLQVQANTKDGYLGCILLLFSSFHLYIIIYKTSNLFYNLYGLIVCQEHSTK